MLQEGEEPGLEARGFFAPERAAHEGLPSKFGPMAETWGFLESLLVQRDHLCRGVADPFGLLAWGRAHRVDNTTTMRACNEGHHS